MVKTDASTIILVQRFLQRFQRRAGLKDSSGSIVELHAAGPTHITGQP